MSSSLPLQLAETIQTASLNRAPSPTHDINPSTSTSRAVPIQTPSSPAPPLHTTHRSHSPPSPPPPTHPAPLPRPRPRRNALPPLPDLRFEQSYLASLHDSTSASAIAYITIRDQVLLPLVQGTLWTLALQGWRFWNRTASFGGRGLGARVRRWWWGVNGWVVPAEGTGNGKGRGGRGGREMAEEVKEVSVVFLKFYQGQMGAGGD